MDISQLAVIGIYVAVGITLLGILVIALFGIKNLIAGKIQPTTLVSVALPALIAVVLYFAMGSWAEAAITTVIVMAGLGVVVLVAGALRGVVR
jgi:hypothetical protein